MPEINILYLIISYKLLIISNIYVIEFISNLESKDFI